MSINQPIILLFNSSLLSRLWNIAKRAIEGFPDAITILGTTPLSVKFTQAQIQHILKRKRWYTCVPDTKTEDDITALDLHTSFLFMTIQKLTDVIGEVNKNPKATFHDEFTKEDFPPLLNFEYDKREILSLTCGSILRLSAILMITNKTLVYANDKSIFTNNSTLFFSN